MQTQQTSWALLFVIVLAVASAFSQQAPSPGPSANAQIVLVGTGYSCGWCSGIYTASELTIKGQSVMTVSRPLLETKRHPAMKAESRITAADWEELKNYIDAKTLAAFATETGCPGCADQPVEGVEVQFSDGSKKSIAYNAGSAPPAIAELVWEIKAIAARGQPVINVSIKPIRTVRPVYPTSAEGNTARRPVTVDVIISKTGEVETAEAVSGPQDLRPAATDAVKQWKWKPYLVNGQPALVRTRATVSFLLVGIKHKEQK